MRRDNLAPQYFDSVVSLYENNRRKGRQELNAEVLDDIDGALWTYSMIDSARLPAGMKQDYSRIVIAVDPATTAGENSDETGIVVAARGADGRGYVLADLSGKYSPQEWATKAIAAYKKRAKDRKAKDAPPDFEGCPKTHAEDSASDPRFDFVADAMRVKPSQPGSAYCDRSSQSARSGAVSASFDAMYPTAAKVQVR